MIKPILLTALLFSMSAAHGQYDTLFVGQANGVSVGPYETPFPTQLVPSARTQYLYPYSEIMQAGMWPGVDIYGLVVDVLDTDPPGTTVDIAVNLKNTIGPCLNSLDLVGLQHVCDTPGVHLDPGTLVLPFNVSTFQWQGGGFCLLVDLMVLRNGGPGLDPRLSMDTTYVCAPSAYAYDTAAVNPGSLNQTNSTYWGNSYKRPVIGFLIPGSLSVQDGEDRIRVALYPNPAEDRITLRLLNGPDHVNIRLTDVLGSIVRNALISTASNGTLEVPLNGLASGCYTVLLVDQGGRPLWQQRVVVR